MVLKRRIPGKSIPGRRPSRPDPAQPPPSRPSAVKGPLASVEKWNQIIASAPDYIEAYYHRGVLLYQQGDYPNAIRDLTYVASRVRPTADLFKYRGMAYLKMEENDKALEDFTSSLKIKPTAELHRERGMIYLSRQDLPRTLADFSASLDLNPNDAELVSKRGTLRHQQGDVEGASADFTRAVELNPRDAQAWTMRGQIRAKKGNFGSAIEDFTRAIQADPNYAIAYLHRSNVHRRMNNVDRAMDDLTDAINIDPRMAKDACQIRALIYFTRGEYAPAIVDFEQYSRLIGDPKPQPEYLESLKRLSKALLQKEELLDALLYLEKLTFHLPTFKVDPAYAEAYYKRGTMALDRGDFENAIRDLDIVTTMNEMHADAIAARAVAQTCLGSYGEAIVDFEKALSIKPTLDLGDEYQAAFQGRALQKIQEGDIDGALADFNWVIENDPGRAIAYAYRSVIKVQSADPEGALQDLDKAMELKPKTEEEQPRRQGRWAAIRRRAMHQEGDSVMDALKSMVQLSSAFDPHEAFARAYLTRGLSSFQHNDYDAAIRDLERAATLRPGIDIGSEYVASFFNRGLKKFQGGDTEGAIVDYTKAIELQPTDLFYTRRAQAHYKQNRHEEADRDFTAAIDMNMSNAEAYYGRAITRYVRNDFGAALEDFTKARILDERLKETCDPYIEDIRAKIA